MFLKQHAVSVKRRSRVSSDGRSCARRAPKKGDDFAHRPVGAPLGRDLTLAAPRLLAARRQLDDRHAARRQLVTMRDRLLANLDVVLAVLDELTRHGAVDEDHVPVRSVATDLALALYQEAVIAHTVGALMRHP